MRVKPRSFLVKPETRDAVFGASDVTSFFSINVYLIRSI